MVAFWMLKSYRPTEEQLEQVRETIMIDATDCILGRLAAKVAYCLMGKHKSVYTPGTHCGDRVVVFNAEKIKVTGNKLRDKVFHRHTGYIGGLKSTILRDRMQKDPAEVIQTAVKRMLPRGPLGRRQLRSLEVFAGASQSRARKPITLDFEKRFGGVNA